MYGLIGYPLSHSFSRSFFTEKFEKENISQEYLNFPLRDIQEFPGLIKNHQELQGLNVTIPYKEKIIPFLDELDTVASEILAVNTIKCIRSHDKIILKGYNTDVYGFRKSLEETIPQGRSLTRALILGTGGASKAVAYVLKSLGINFDFVSTRSRQAYSYEDLSDKIMDKCQLIVNTTPLGTFPDTDQCPDIPYHLLHPDHILFDLIYNPSLSLFLKKGKERGATISNGLKMLEYQALKSWEIWNS
ncbi:MAG: shikimate dehydrogenase [Bacteroidales bacterium]|nr:shikimate dehydrogenase [Bacteroidales bacterium]MCB9013622.1 shikimate dehydrogenase [Bacteroidales bacterium]